ncbi:MAG: dephospho-CoA kinase, partial [Rikenellaceae bacterium]|nr:dephospho-CoA kinase [Rikenellaceae bacterium]
MKRLGVTGGIGSGKSTICELLARRGVPIYDSDSRAKKLMNSELQQPIRALFGEQAYNDSGLNRSYIASRAFGNPELLARLNAIVHPAVADDFERWAENFEGQVQFVALESAILYESGFDSRVDAVLCVDAPLDVRIERTVKRDGSSREEVEKRVVRQRTDVARQNADFVIVTDGKRTLDDLVDELFENLDKLWN